MTKSESTVARPLSQSNSTDSPQLPYWVVQGGFTEFVMASRHFAETGSWPNGQPPYRPRFWGLSTWQICWIVNQKNPAKFARWSESMKERSRVKRAARRAEVMAEVDAESNGPSVASFLSLSKFIADRKVVR